MRKLIGFTFALLLAACGDSSGGTDGPPPIPDQAVHCAWSDGTCSQASKPTFSEAERTTGAADCATLTGTWGDGACDAASAVPGYCFYVDFEAETGIAIAGLTLRDYYATASWDGTTAPADCAAAGGSWTTGAGVGSIVESEANGTTGTADPLPLGGTAEGTSASPSERDFYVFVVPEGGRDVRFKTFDSTGTGCSVIDPLIQIQDSSGTILANIDEWGDYNCEDWSLSLPAGTYYVFVAGYVGGDYVLKTSATRMSTPRFASVSCTYASLGGCRQLTGTMSAADTANVSVECEREGGSYSGSACPTANAVSGYCALGASSEYGPDVTGNAYFFTSSWSSSTAPAFCTGTVGGTWVP